MSRLRSPSNALAAVLALCCQLWLAGAHAYAGVAGPHPDAAEFCGGGDSQRLRAQLAPELRAPAGGPGDCCDGACQVCAPPCSPALPLTPVVTVDVPRANGVVQRVAAGPRYVRPRPHKPPATGPPAMH